MAALLPEAAPRMRPDPMDGSGGVTEMRGLKYLNRMSPLRLFLGAVHNHRATRNALLSFKPDVVYCFSVDGIGYEVYHVATESGIPSVTVAGDTWLAQAWRDLPKFDPWIGLASGRGATGIRTLAKMVVGRCGAAAGLYVGRRPANPRAVQGISNFLLQDLKKSMMPLEGRLTHVPVPLFPPYISNSGEPAGRLGPRTAALRVLFVSRMERGKGPDIAIRAVGQAVSSGADVTLTLAGIPMENIEHQLNTLASDLGIASRVRIVESPDSEDLFLLYREHDVFIFPSRIIEGFGIVCAEAMACGLPVLATDTGGQTDLVRDGENGFICQPEDFRKFGEYLARMARDRALLEKLSDDAVRSATKHHGARVVDMAEQLLFVEAGMTKD